MYLITWQQFSKLDTITLIVSTTETQKVKQYVQGMFSQTLSSKPEV